MVTVCAVALQAQVIETPIETPTCVERGKPGDLSAAGEGSISSVWSTSDQREGGRKARNENERRGKQMVWQARQRGKVRSDGLVCDAGEQARTYVCM